MLERDERRALGVTVEGIPVELVRAGTASFGTELLRATGSAEYVAALEPLPEAATEEEVYARSASRTSRPSSARRRSATSRRRSSAERTSAATSTATRRGRTARRRCSRWPTAARDRGYEYLAICDHTPNVRVVPGLDADALRRQAEEIAAANEALAPFRVLRGTECDIRADGSLDLPDDVLAELDWVQLSLHAGQRLPRGS